MQHEPNIRYIVVSVDYEIFGNGSGDVIKHITDPTERMARICEDHGAPLTIYFEAEEFAAFRKFDEQLTKDLGYSPANAIERQALDLARRGHDFQLHLHPEWVGCDYADKQWKLDRTKRTVDSLFGTAEETIDYIGQRKRDIEELLDRAQGSQREVCAYRAGAFSAQPSHKLVKALEANGFTIDSSAVRGYYERTAHVNLDYSYTPDRKRYWRVSDDVGREDSSGPIVEVPIYSRMGRRYHQATPKRLLAKFSKDTPKEKQKEMVDSLGFGKNPFKIARFLLSRFPIKLDFHNMSPGQMIRWIRNAPKPEPGELDVIMMIGHTKEHRNDREFATFLREVERDPSLKVVSLTDVNRLLALAPA